MDLLKMFHNEYFVTKIEIYRKECTSRNVRIQAVCDFSDFHKDFRSLQQQLPTRPPKGYPLGGSITNPTPQGVPPGGLITNPTPQGGTPLQLPTHTISNRQPRRSERVPH